MVLGRRWLCCCLICVGCRTMPDLQTQFDASADQLWENGQAAMRNGETLEAIQLYEQSLAADPCYYRNHLSLAAAYLEQKNDGAACLHLEQYVEAVPEQPHIRSRYAELLVRNRRLADARDQFEWLIAYAQEREGMPARNQIYCHSRIVEIAEEAEDEYHLHLHRGIGLFLVARKRSAMEDQDGELQSEGLFCKAAAELTLAHLQRPDEARPCWYLYRIWSQLGQRQPAQARLREADLSAPFSYLTLAEHRDLHLACQVSRNHSEPICVSIYR